jgi:L-fuconolactonase
MTSERIDAHQHFWQLARGDYGWLTPALAPIYRDYGPVDLRPHLARCGIARTVLVQAAPTEAETRHLLDLAARSDGLVAGVVGWVDMEAPDAPVRIAALASDPRLVGLRPMIQDIPDPTWMLRPELEPAFRTIIGNGLAFDALVKPPHLPHLLRLLARHPDLRTVVDHGAKPDIAHGAFEPWARDIAAIARETHALVKLSGLVTEAAADWRAAELRPYVEHLITCFGPTRIMWGSDWPVLELRASYARWFETTGALLAGLSAAERVQILGDTACAFYRLDRTRSTG